jgi:hypothetical protein
MMSKKESEKEYDLPFLFSFILSRLVFYISRKSYEKRIEPFPTRD